MKKSISFLVVFILTLSYVFAQDQRDMLKEYEEFRKNSVQKYNDFRDQANAEYAEFMRQAWKEFGAEPPIPVPPSPDPIQPPVFDPDEEPSSDSIPIREVLPPVKRITPPQPVIPIPVKPISVLPLPKMTPVDSIPIRETLPPVEPISPSKPVIPISVDPISVPTLPELAPVDVPLFSFVFYGTECRVRLGNEQKIYLKDISEATIADAWEILSAPSYNPVIADCLHLRDELKLCDWGYYQLLKTIADKYYGVSHSNESVLFQMFILTQSGYKIRIARTDNSLSALLPFDHTVFSYAYLLIDGIKFYVIDKSLLNSRFYVCDYSFPKEQTFSMQINSLPEFSHASTATRTLATVRYPIKVEIETNQNLIDFLNSVPLSSEWNLYANSSLSEQIKEQLYPVLKDNISGKSLSNAANLLLNFVQAAFVYQTDEVQFGYERPLFGDETFHYPACDCEDRSILFSILVKDLLGLDVVLLHYPNHLATAVRFNEDVEGDFLVIDDQKYIICDPTYLGANIGREMSSCKNKKPRVIKI